MIIIGSNFSKILKRMKKIFVKNNLDATMNFNRTALKPFYQSESL